MRILPWTLAVPESGLALIVPRLPFPYLLRSVLLQFAITEPQYSCAHVSVVDGAGGSIYLSTSELWNSSANPGTITFAPGLARSSAGYDAASGVNLPPLGVWTQLSGVNSYSCQGALPADLWIMPAMQLRLFATSLSGVVGGMTAARLIIGVP